MGSGDVKPEADVDVEGRRRLREERCLEELPGRAGRKILWRRRAASADREVSVGNLLLRGAS